MNRFDDLDILELDDSDDKERLMADIIIENEVWLNTAIQEKISEVFHTKSSLNGHSPVLLLSELPYMCYRRTHFLECFMHFMLLPVLSQTIKFA